MAVHLLEQGLVDRIIAADIKGLDSAVCTDRMKSLFATDQWEFCLCDVRRPIEIDVLEEVTLIFNLAAIHREPGHEPHEYYETNLPGAENVCAWAEQVSCKTIVFTSSIAPYGPTEEPKDETSVPTPTTAYGGSKLVAEKIHQIWQSRDSMTRRLVILRPGVVFGAGEGGNVSRLIKAILGGYFVYTGNQETRKAGIYVKELCSVMTWMLAQQSKNKDNFLLFNLSMQPAPTIEDYVSTVCEVERISRATWSMPFGLIFVITLIFVPLLHLLGYGETINLTRVRKTVKSNNIVPGELLSRGYKFSYTLEEAFLDWRSEMPAEWRGGS